MTNVNAKRAIRIVSHWGDCIVLKSERGNCLEIVASTGETITRSSQGQNATRQDEPKKPQQLELFGADNESKFQVNAYSYVPMPTRERTGGKG